MVIPSIGCLLLTLCTDQWIPVMIILTLVMGTRAAAFAGRDRVPYEVVPDYSGPTYGFINAFSECAGFVTPLITTAFTGYDETDPVGWNHLFYLASGLIIGPYIMFLFAAKFDHVQLI